MSRISNIFFRIRTLWIGVGCLYLYLVSTWTGGVVAPQVLGSIPLWRIIFNVNYRFILNLFLAPVVEEVVFRGFISTKNSYVRMVSGLCLLATFFSFIGLYALRTESALGEAYIHYFAYQWYNEQLIQFITLNNLPGDTYGLAISLFSYLQYLLIIGLLFFVIGKIKNLFHTTAGPSHGIYAWMGSLIAFVLWHFSDYTYTGTQDLVEYTLYYLVIGVLLMVITKLYGLFVAILCHVHLNFTVLLLSILFINLKPINLFISYTCLALYIYLTLFIRQKILRKSMV